MARFISLLLMVVSLSTIGVFVQCFADGMTIGQPGQNDMVSLVTPTPVMTGVVSAKTIGFPLHPDSVKMLGMWGTPSLRLNISASIVSGDSMMLPEEVSDPGTIPSYVRFGVETFDEKQSALFFDEQAKRVAETDLELSSLFNHLADMGNPISSEDKLKCQDSPLKCLEDQGAHNIVPEKSEDLPKPRERKAICGNTLMVQPEESLVLDLNNLDSEVCQVNLKTINDYRNKYYFEFVEKPLLKFGDCQTSYFMIIQNKRVQKYCGQHYFLSEFPSHIENATLIYVNRGPLAKESSLKVHIRSVAMPRNTSTSSYHFTQEYQDYRSYSAGSNEIRTFDMKHASFQACPKECGSVVQYPHRLPRRAENVPNEVDQQDYPWIVNIYLKFRSGGVQIFSGSIINSEAVLTSFDTLKFDTSLPNIESISFSPELFEHVENFNFTKADHLSLLFWSYDSRTSNIFPGDDGLDSVPKAMLLLKPSKPLKLGFKSSPVCLGSLQNLNGANLKAVRILQLDGIISRHVITSSLLTKEQCIELLGDDYSEGLICSEIQKTSFFPKDLEGKRVDYEMIAGSPLFVKMGRNHFQVGVVLHYFFNEKSEHFLVSANVVEDSRWVTRGGQSPEEYCV